MASQIQTAPKYLTHLTRASTDEQGSPRSAFKTLEKILRDGKLIASPDFIIQPPFRHVESKDEIPPRNRACSFSAVELFEIYKNLVQYRKDRISKGASCLDIDPYGIIEKVDSYTTAEQKNPYLIATRKRDFEYLLSVNGQTIREAQHVPHFRMTDLPYEDYYLRRRKSTKADAENISWEWEQEWAKKDDFELSRRYIILVKRAIEKSYLRMAFTLDGMNGYAKKKMAIFSFEELNGFGEEGIHDEHSVPEVTESELDLMMKKLAEEGKSEQADLICKDQTYDHEKKIYSKILGEWSAAPLDNR